MYRLRDDTLNITDLANKNMWQTYFSCGATILQSIAGMSTGGTMLFVGHKLKVRSRLYATLAIFVFCLVIEIIFVKLHLRKCKYRFFNLII